MSRDYAKKTKAKPNARRSGQPHRRKPPKRKSKPTNSTVPVLWLVAGVCVGLFIAGLVFLKTNHHPPTIKRHHIKSKQTAQQKPERATGPRFDFYSILPKTKVWAPTPKGPVAPVPTQPPVPVAFMVQVAAFQHYKDADNLKARLLLQGFNVTTKSVKSNGVTWQQVFIGPYPTQLQARKVQARLLKQKFQTLLVRVKE